MTLILASASPRRQQLLTELNVPFVCCPANIDESPRAMESPRSLVMRLALSKAQHVAVRHPEAWVLGADTIVVIEDQVLGKPSDASDAMAMLQRLSGRAHQVLSAVVLCGPNGQCEQALSVSQVVFATLDQSWIARYVASGEPMDKAGAYAIQGGASTRIAHLEGSYSGVVGLPMYETARLLEAAGLLN